MLVHMTPREVAGLQSLAVANGTSLTINPDTGLPEAFSLKDLLPTLAGAAINYFAPGFGTAIGGALGLSGAAGTGLAVGAATAALSGDLGKGLSAGLGAYGGAGISEGLMGLGTGAAATQAGNLSAMEADQLAQNAVGSRLAAASKFDTLSAGASKAMNDPMSAIKTIGGGSTGKGLALAAAALSPLLAGETGNTVQTVTPRRLPRPKQPSVYDNMSQTFERYAANGGLMGLAHGGAVHYENGGEVGAASFDMNDYITNYVKRFEPSTATGAGFAATPAAQAPVAQAPVAQAPVAQSAPAQGFTYTSGTAPPAATNTGAGIAALPSAGAVNTGAAMSSPAGSGNATGNIATGAGLGVNYAGQATSPLITDQVFDLFKDVLDRPPSENDMKYWATQFGINNNKVDSSEIDDFKKAAAGELSKRQASDSGKDYMLNTEANLDKLYMQELSRHGEYGTAGKEGGMEFWKRTFGDYIDPKELAGFRTEAAKERTARENATRPDVVTDLTKANPVYIKEGVGGATGAGQIGGGTVVNPNGTITTSPRIPGIPVGGFEGMTQVKDAYTKGGGDLGYTSPTYTEKTFADKYKNTGYDKEMYAYLMGKGDKPTMMKNADGTFQEIARPYTEATLGVPGSTNVKRIWDKVKGEYYRNPDYMRQRTIRDPVTKAKSTINYMSVNQAKAALNKTPLEGNALAEWSIDNFVDPETLAEATGMNENQITTLLAKAKQDKAFKKAEGGLMSLANGGLANGGLPEKERTNSVTGVKYYFDFDNGIYRAETTVKDGVTYKWNPLTNKYETGAAAGTGITGLLNMSGDGPPAGGENRPPWDSWTPEQKAQFYDDNPTLQSITLAGQKALSFLGITNPLQAAIANGKLGLSGYNNFGKESTIPSGGIVSPGQADRDYGKSSFGKSGSADQDVDSFSAPDAPPGGGDIAEGSPDPGERGGEQLAYGGMIGHYAQGGLGSLGGYSDGGRLLRGPGDGVSDSIPASIGNRQPARLADGEFVVPARIVSELGNGSTEAGARALYKMMDRIQANRRKTTGKNSVAVNSKSHKYLPA